MRRGHLLPNSKQTPQRRIQSLRDDAFLAPCPPLHLSKPSEWLVTLPMHQWRPTAFPRSRHLPADVPSLSPSSSTWQDELQRVPKAHHLRCYPDASSQRGSLPSLNIFIFVDTSLELSPYLTLALCPRYIQFAHTVPPWMKALSWSALYSPPAPSMGHDHSEPSMNTYWIVYKDPSLVFFMYHQGLWLLTLKFLLSRTHAVHPHQHTTDTDPMPAVLPRSPNHHPNFNLLLPPTPQVLAWRNVSCTFIQVLKNSCLIL